jgi:hypothetical protein
VDVLGYSRGSLGSIFAALVGCFTFLVSGISQHRFNHLWYGAVLGVLAGWIFLSMRAKRSKTHVTPARLRVTADALEIEGRPPLRKSDILSAYLQPRTQELPIVRVRGRYWASSVDLGMKNQAQGKRLLESLGQDPSHAVARFRVRAGFENKTLRGLVSGLTAMGWLGMNMTHAFSRSSAMSAAYTTFFILVAAAMLSTFMPTTVTIGSDGVLVQKVLGSRFIPFAEVESIGTSMRSPHVIVLYLRDGKTIDLRTRANDRKVDVNDEARAIRVRLDEALAGFRLRDGGTEAIAWLARGARSTREWLGALRALSGDAGYRNAAILPEQLWRIVEDPGAEPSARAGAVVALGQALDAEGKERVRRVALASASPRVRVALSAAVSKPADDPEVTRAFDELGTPEAEAEAEAEAEDARVRSRASSRP